MTGVWGQDQAQVQCFRGWSGEKPKLRTIPGVSTREHLSPFFVLLTPQILSQWGPVCAGKREAGGHSLPSRNQCCPAGPDAPRGHVQCLPCICPHPPPRDGLKRSERVPSTGPAGWVAGASRRGGRRGHESVSGEGRSSASWQAQPTFGHTAPLSEVKGS